MQHAIQQEKRYFSKVYRLIKPYQIEEVEIARTLNTGEVAVKPTLGSICHADLRYFTGNRRPESLAAKLPMALIHEGIGEVVNSRSDAFVPGQRVLIVPNIPGYVEKGPIYWRERYAGDAGLDDNYSENGRFLGSGTDGIAQSLLILPEICVVPIPEEVPSEIAVLSEISTIPHQALSRVRDLLHDTVIAVFGDGPVGYVTAALLHHHYHIPRERIKVFGVVPEKLAQFEFATCLNVGEYNFQDGEKVDMVIECTGGKFSSAAINQAIDVIKPGGHLILLGVTEELVPVNTRDILEKGITIFGSSRSSFRDYPPVLQSMKDSAYQRSLRRLLPDQLTKIHSYRDFADTMRHTSEHPHWQKVVMSFEWPQDGEGLGQ